MNVAWPARLGLLVFLGWVLGAGCASLGGIEGRLGRPGPAKFDNTIVYLVSRPPERVSGHSKAELVADESGFSPAVLPVAVGTRVTFHNKDKVFHKPFSISPAKPFDVGAMAPGDKRTVVFDHAGVIQVFCELHPQASAYIVVVPTRRFARVDGTGAFRFSNVGRGDYTLKAWHPDRGESSVEVQMPDRGDLQVTIP